MKTRVLDCTLRDGGYYCAWDFDDDLVRRYLAAVSAAGVDAVEMGFRANTMSGFAGRYAYCRDATLRDLTEPYDLEVAVMIDGKDFIRKGVADTSPFKTLFAPVAESPVDLIRITATITTAEAVGEMANALSEMGYPVSVNLMRSSMLTEDEIEAAGRILADSKAAVAYLADSFGGLLPDETARKVAALKRAFGRDVGFHPHDNLGLALANTLAAISGGADVVDSSVLGMGRGAGNLRTEQLLLVLRERLGQERFRVSPLFDLVTGDFARLQERFGWGPTLPFMLAGAYDVHPMYPQTLLEYPPKYSPREVIQVMDAVHVSGKGDSFNVGILAEGLQRRSYSGRPMVSVNALERHRNTLPSLDTPGGTFLIVGAGPSVRQRAADLNAFIRSRHPFVLECNHQPALDTAERHASVFLNYGRLRDSIEAIVARRDMTILGLDTVEDELASLLNGIDSYHYPFSISSADFQVAAEGCVLPDDLVGMYAMAVAIQLGAEEILLAGFDGYLGQNEGNRAPLRVEHVLAGRGMEAFFRLLRRYEPIRDGRLTVRSLTPTEYDVEVNSLYNFV